MSSVGQRALLAWHVHGSWMQALVAGEHRYLIPVNAAKDADGRGLLGRDWPQAREVDADRLRDEDIDLVILQRPEEIELTERWTGRRPGVDVPAVFVEHNAPRPLAVDSVHPLAERSDIPVVHVTDFNRLMWDNGKAPTMVIDHGIADPGMRYRGDIAAAATMINEPLRRWRTVGTDLLAPLGARVPIDVWGIGTPALAERDWPGVHAQGDVPGPQLWQDVARRRVFLHTARWTSLGLSLLEAMFLGMPVVAVASTMAPLVVPAEAGVVSADVETLASALEGFVSDPSAARAAGKAARDFAVAHFSLDRFLRDWDRLIDDCCR
ncbi:glycosyltransferase [Mycolicibacterium litorale]|uniref:Glycosyl transferase n=1 Tax=Mycolicibacterium litorale TaxID=758802 RepID=A0AAD1IKU4_9MYCO|nr:glycosyltransferase [Mycolicibacterium litorale]MCV7416093.1 glycosyltransferase [Mycolicibacterium litorale]TDY09344.1 glycosyl transferase family 1 [Mycolicibacterium litorale]BBY17289.1 glycosyl transferase [Mycolicibacterium litorale]